MTSSLQIKSSLFTNFNEDLDEPCQGLSSSVFWGCTLKGLDNFILQAFRGSEETSDLIKGKMSSEALNNEAAFLKQALPFNMACNSVLVVSSDANEETAKASADQILKVVNANLQFGQLKGKDFYIVFALLKDNKIVLSKENTLSYHEEGEVKKINFDIDPKDATIYELSKKYFGLYSEAIIPFEVETIVNQVQKSGNQPSRQLFANLKDTHIYFSNNEETPSFVNKDTLKDFFKNLKALQKGRRDDFLDPLMYVPFRELSLLFNQGEEKKGENIPNLVSFEKQASICNNKYQFMGYFKYEDDLTSQIQAFLAQISEAIRATEQNQFANPGHFGSSDNLVLCFRNNFCGLGFSISSLKSRYTQQTRKFYHQRFGVPLNFPAIREADSLVSYNKLVDMDKSGKLRNVHYSLNYDGVEGGTKYLIWGNYTYHHYMQDGFDDNGWGCAYRSLQTLLSWFKHQQLGKNYEIPSIREIQQILIDIGDKKPNFYGTKEWIGAFEVNLVLQKLVGVESVILFIQDGTQVETKARELKEHFQKQGTPIMIGGGVLAYTLLGIDYNETTGDIKFLILDPHYTGSDNLKPIQDKGWIGWKEKSIFLEGKFYNLCMPQRPTEI